MKDNTDRHDLSLPARRPSTPPVAPPQHTEAYEDYAEAPAPSTKRVSLRLVIRAVRRHWLIALILWTLSSAGLAALAYYKVKPTYDAFTHVRVELDRNGYPLGVIGRQGRPVAVHAGPGLEDHEPDGPRYGTDQPP